MDEREKKFVDFKLEFLEETALGLHQAVDDYISGVLSAGKSWIGDSERVHSFQEMSQLLEDSILFMGKKCKEISDGPNHEMSAVSSSSESPTISSGKDAEGQPSSLSLQTTAAVVGSVSAPLVAGCPTVRKILTRMDILEEAMASFCSTSQTVSANQSRVESQVEGFDVKQLKLEEEINVMNEKQTELGGEQSKRVSDIEKKLKRVKTNQTEMGKQQDKRLKDVEKQLHTLATKQTEMDKQISERFEEMETEKTLAREEMNSIKSQLDDLDQKSDSLEEKCQDMQAKIETNDTSIHEQMAKRNKDQKRMKRMEEKLKTVETKVCGDVDKLGEKYKEVNENFKIVCSMIAKRVLPLERLRDIFNRCKKRVEDRETVMGKYNDVLAKLEELSKRTEHMEAVSLKQPIGFTAELPGNEDVKAKDVITSFNYILSNEGNHYNRNTGVFTAPQDGFYMASLTIEQEGDGEISVAVIHSQTTGDDEGVCSARTFLKKTSGCCVGLVRMKTGDKLYVEPWQVKGNVNLNDHSTFSCCLVG